MMIQNTLHSRCGSRSPPCCDNDDIRTCGSSNSESSTGTIVSNNTMTTKATTTTTKTMTHTTMIGTQKQQHHQRLRRPNQIHQHQYLMSSSAFSFSRYIWLLVGILIGFWYGQQLQKQQSYSNKSNQPPFLTNRNTISTTTATIPSQQIAPIVQPHHRSDGWQIIHVYNGPIPTEEKDDSFMSSSLQSSIVIPTQGTVQHDDDYNSINNSNNTKERRIVWYSQAHQDELIIGMLHKNRTNGYYIDLAANDAKQLSNTYALQQYYNWSGLCIEPNPIYWYNLSYYRRSINSNSNSNCIILGAVIGSPFYKEEEIYFRFHAGDHGGIANDGFNNGKRWQKESQRRYTIPLIDLLQKYNVPNVIDYLSLDVEGAETYILQNFPFHLYHIKIITAERLRGPIRHYLNQNGYKFIQKLTKWGESLWVHTSYYNDIDWTILQQYNFPI
jgi:hypothetical protein